MYVKEIYVIFIHLFDSGLLLIIDLNKNLNLLFTNLLLMIQFYIPWEGEGGYDENLKYKHRTGH
jgi:hypothetical protein